MSSVSRRTVLTGSAALVAAGAVTAATAAPAGAHSAPRSKPTVVLVHGAFADASGWNEVIRLLGRDGPNVKALVYVAAFAPDEGDTVLGLQTRFPGSKRSGPVTRTRCSRSPDRPPGSRSARGTSSPATTTSSPPPRSGTWHSGPDPAPSRRAPRTSP